MKKLPLLLVLICSSVVTSCASVDAQSLKSLPHPLPPVLPHYSVYDSSTSRYGASNSDDLGIRLSKQPGTTKNGEIPDAEAITTVVETAIFSMMDYGSMSLRDTQAFKSATMLAGEHMPAQIRSAMEQSAIQTGVIRYIEPIDLNAGAIQNIAIETFKLREWLLDASHGMFRAKVDPESIIIDTDGNTGRADVDIYRFGSADVVGRITVEVSLRDGVWMVRANEALRVIGDLGRIVQKTM